ncbi:MAG: hypothetical protein HOP16_16410, partial [Acidobacteria bacterium]|nr:hypothetical protein [Acidobacteriota bacterium]
MDKDLLDTLSGNQSRTLSELRSADRAAYDALARTIGEERKRLVVDAAGQLPKQAADAIDRIDPAALAFGPLSDAVNTALARRKVNARVRGQVLDRLAASLPGDHGDIPTDVPLERVPSLQPTLARAALASFATRARLGGKSVEALVDATGSIESVSDTVVTHLVEGSKLGQVEARQLGLHLSLYHLADGDATVAHALAGATFKTLGGPLGDVRDLVRLSTSEIEQALRAAKVSSGTRTPEQQAEAIRRRATNAFPEITLLGSEPDEQRPTRDHLTRARKVIEANADRFGQTFADLDFSGVPKAEIESVRLAYTELVTLTRRYPGLGLESLIAKGGAPKDVAAAVSSRIALLDTVVKANPEVELLAIDYAPDGTDLAKLNMPGLNDKERQAVLSTLKARQRVFAAAVDPDDAMRVSEAGYVGAMSIADDDVETFQLKTGLPMARAKQIHQRADETSNEVMVILGTIVDLIWGNFIGLPVGNVQPDVTDGLRQIEGYADMFGPQDHCHCEHCSSILSPAAYFVDLMLFIEQHVLVKIFAGATASHALNLEMRRPDLWTLELNCANTSDLIPTLDVINEILESYLAKARNPAINLDDRAAIRDLVYQQVLAQVPRSFVLPFVLPVFTADAYLELFDVTRGTITRAFGATEPRVTAAVLKMARGAYDILIAPNLGQPYLTGLFRVPFAVGGGGAIAAVDVQPFLRGAGITHEQLESLARSSFVRAGTASTIRLVPQKLSSSSVQNDVERITGLNLGVLDRMHRLLRLCAHTGWTLDEVDLVIEQRVAAGAAPVMDPDALRDVATVRDLTQTFQLPVDVTCALWSRIPMREVTPGARSLFDRLFNNRPYTLTEGNLPQDTTSFVVPAFRTTPVPGTDNTLQRLLLGLQVDDTGLTALVRGLATALGANPTARVESDRAFRLTLANLTLLYRHATLARQLERPVPDLFRLMSFAGMRSVASIRGLRSLIEFDTWFRGAGLSLDDLAFITGRPVEAADQYPNAIAVTTEVLARVTAENALTFAPTALAFIRTITEDLSRRIFRDNAALFDSVADDRLRLKSTVAPDAAVVTPAGMSATLAAQVRTAIMRHHTANVLPAQLATALRISRDKLSVLAAMAAIDLGSAEMRAALLGGARTPLETAVTTLSRLTILFRADAYTTPRLSFMSSNPAIFGVVSFAALTVPNVQTITRYRDLVTPPIDPAARARDPQAVDDALVRFTAAQKFAGIAPPRLGQALAVDATAAAMLQSAMTLGGDAVEALGALAAMTALVASVRLDIPTLALLSSEQPADLSAGAEALVSALARLYPDDKDTRLEPKDDRIRSAKRDALTDYIIRESAGRFESLDDLYEYFLLDVQLQGCARTSRVVAAISSLQTYVHRILLNLEQDRRAAGPTHVHILPDQIPADEWSWRKNYRVWEANRKVFLWPENYIEPEMRDDKTPLFRALEEGLLQQDINEQNVLDAYGAYLAGLEAAGGLTIAGVYHEFNAAGQTDVLHLFGATPVDPPEYYYWTITNLHSSRVSAERRVSYSPRRKIEVSIPTRAITPVVYLGRLFVFWTETATSSRHEMLSGNFTFAGYKHQHRIKFTSLRLDGRWVAPQEMRSDGAWLGLGTPDFMRGGVVIDKLGAKGRSAQSISIGGTSVPSQIPFYATDGQQHNEPKDDYSLRGAHWERLACEPIWSNRLFVNYGAYMFNEHADLFDRKFKSNELSVLDGLRTIWAPQRRVLHIGQDGAARRLYAPTSSPNNVLPLAVMSPSAFQYLVADDDTTRFWEGRGYEPTRVSTFVGQLKLTPALRGAPVGTLRITDARATGIGGAAGGTGLVLSAGTDALCVLQDPATSSSGWMGLRIGTTLIRELSQTLFTGGIDLLLDIETQKNLGEGPHLLTSTSGLTVLGPAQAGTIDFQGPLGVYYREVYFHIPFLIANHLNGRQNYRAAQDWYHYIFNPTAPPDADPPMNGMTGTQRTQALRDRVWRYIQFRGLTPLRLRELLRDDDAIEAYKKDPLNPHAIARSRLSAYQKSVVMKYVSNLMDWADSLFSEFTTESINEAMVLYAMASEILGPPPADVGACGEATVTPRNYRKIRSALKRGNEFLLEIETRMAIGTKAKRLQRRRTSSYLSYRRPDNEIAASRLERDAAGNATLETSASRSMTRAADDAGVDRIEPGTVERARMLAGAGAMTAGAISTELPIPDMTPGIANQLLREGIDPAPSRQL